MRDNVPFGAAFVRRVSGVGFSPYARLTRCENIVVFLNDVRGAHPRG